MLPFKGNIVGLSKRCIFAIAILAILHLYLLRYFPSTNLVDRADNCYTSLYFYFSSFSMFIRSRISKLVVICSCCSFLSNYLINVASSLNDTNVNMRTTHASTKCLTGNDRGQRVCWWRPKQWALQKTAIRLVSFAKEPRDLQIKWLSC